MLTIGLTTCGIAQLIPAIVYNTRGPSPTTGKVSFRVSYIKYLLTRLR